MKQYYQCRLRRGNFVTTGWIEARGAKLGAVVELLPSHERWEVTMVHTHGLLVGAYRPVAIDGMS